MAMGRIAVVSDVVERIITIMEGSDKMDPYWGGRNKAEQGREIVGKIQHLAVFAEKSMEAENENTNKDAVLRVLKRLKPVVYKMEDVLDEVDMCIREEQRIRPGGKLTKHLCTMASKPGRSLTKSHLATQLKAHIGELGDILHETDPIFGNYTNMFAKPEYQLPQLHALHPVVEREAIYGREMDKKAIIDILLSDSIHHRVGVNERQVVDVVSILGMGGVGKTNLAQLVYNDSTVARNFDLRVWVCESEYGNWEGLIKKILASMNDSPDVDLHGFTLELLEKRLQDIITGKKFLLVLDDVWKENQDSWSTFLYSLRDAKQGSKILVTTRSPRVAHVLCSHIYHLSALTEEQVWSLFTENLFKEGQEKMNPSFTELGKQFVRLSGGSPLLIHIISNILRDKPTLEEWEMVLHNIHNIRGTMPKSGSTAAILELAYIDLPQQLKKCFAYCSLFPEDYEYNKSDMIYLWMAQGYIKPLNGSYKTLEEAGNEYIMFLLRRGIFQDAAQDENGKIISFRMHDLLHELAQTVAQEDNVFAAVGKCDIEPDSVVHVSFLIDSEWEAPSWLFTAKQLRSLLLFPADSAVPITIPDMDRLFSSLRRLRALALDKVDCKHLPDSIRHLKHLRYLKLGDSLESLPTSITRLQCLQILDLQACGQYVKFPKGFTNINGVRVLCNLQHIKFVVDESKGLKELVSSLDKPVGKLEINFKNRRAKSLEEARDANLKSIHVTDIVFEWSSSYGEPDFEDAEDKLLQRLQPSPYLNTLVVRFWKGMKFTDWGIDYLVSAEIEGCSKCQELPPFHKLPYLKTLYLLNLKSLEYVENNHNCNGAPSASYFRCLEALKLEELPKLKGWCRVKGNAESVERGSQQYLPLQSSFPCLSNLTIYLCPKLMSLPQAPMLRACSMEEIPAQLVEQFTLPVPSTLDRFKELQIVSIFQLQSLSVNNSPHKCLRIKRCDKLVDLFSKSPIFQLEICSCVKLTNICGGLQYVEVLKIWLSEELDLWVNTDKDNLGVDHVITSSNRIKSLNWKDLKWLRLLTIGSIRKLELLPKGLNYLTALQELKLFKLCNLRGLPKWIGGLTQLRLLEIVECPTMRKLFDNPSNEPDVFEIDLKSLTIKVERCRELLNLFQENPVSFQRLEVDRCAKLNSISGAEIEIKELVVNCCDELPLWVDKQEGGVGANFRKTAIVAWQSLKSVNALTLNRISKLVSYPKGLCYLTLLQELKMFQLQIEVLPLQIDYFTQLRWLEIENCLKLKKMSLSPDIDAGEDTTVYQKHFLKFLRIDKCPKLLSMTIGYGITVENCEFRHCHSMKEISGNDLVIKKLVVDDCSELDLWNDEADDTDISSVLPAACQVLNSVQSLTLSNISKLETLPKGLQYNKALEDLEINKLCNFRTLPEWVNQLTQLEFLDIRECPMLATLPHSLRDLTKLQRLVIRGCSPELKSRCQQINGKDWPSIQHIPKVIVA